MKVYMVRHGEVDDNLLGLYNLADDSLNEHGIEQAIQLREKIKTINYDIVISSPLLRAIQTASLINVGRKKIILDSRLRERELGSLGGQPLDSVDREDYWNYYSNHQYGTSESVRSLFERVYTFLDELQKSDYHSVLIVAHSGVSKAFHGYFCGLKDGKFLNRGLKNCEIMEYQLTEKPIS